MNTNTKALSLLMGPYLIKKLQRLQRFDTRTCPQVYLLALCAYIVASVSYHIEDLPLESAGDLAQFKLEGLDLALQDISEALQKDFPDDPVGGLLAFIEINDYRLSEHYRERKERIIKAGRYSLLTRISGRVANLYSA